MTTPPAPRRPYAPPTDPDAPLDEIEQALVRMFVQILVREIHEGASWWTDNPPGDPDHASTSASNRRRAG